MGLIGFIGFIGFKGFIGLVRIRVWGLGLIGFGTFIGSIGLYLESLLTQKNGLLYPKVVGILVKVDYTSGLLAF